MKAKYIEKALAGGEKGMNLDEKMVEKETEEEDLPKRPRRRRRWVCGPKRPVKGSTKGLKNCCEEKPKSGEGGMKCLSSCVLGV